MQIRSARETDIPGIRDVANRSLAASYDDVLDAEARQRAVELWYGPESSPDSTFAEEIAGDRTVVIVAKDDDEIVGFAQAFVSEDTPRVGRIEWLHVRPERREEGIADRLLAEIESALEEDGAEQIEASVVEANEAGRAFYEHHGYELSHTRQVQLAGDQVAELTLVADAESTPEAGTERRETEDGTSVVIAYDESERGSDGPFHPTYLDEEREEHYGWHCSVCDGFDVSVGSMEEFVCNDCGNKRRAMRWDAVYGG
jgi:ribosomal protein S18 acetylase RimI-like enzyme